MTFKKKDATVKVANSTEPVLGKAAAKLEEGLGSIKAALDNAASVIEQAKIAQAGLVSTQAEIDDLDTKYAEKLRQAEFDFGFKLKENKKAIVAKVLAAEGMSMVKSSDYTELQNSLAKAQQETKAEVGKAEGIITNRLTSQFNNEKALYLAEVKAAGAEDKAKLASYEIQLKMLETTNAMLIAQLNAERSAGIERSKSQSATVNVTPTGK